MLLARALRPRRAVVVHPQFTEPEAALRAAGHAVERAVLDGGFTLDPARVPEDADLVVIGNPTNPTSVLHPAETVAALARPGRVLVVDEAFADTVPGEPESLASRTDLPGLVVLRSLTKTWGLAGLRVGYVLAAPELVDRLAAAAPPWSVSTPALVALSACTTAGARAEADDAAHALAADRAHLVDALARVAGCRGPGRPGVELPAAAHPGPRRRPGPAARARLGGAPRRHVPGSGRRARARRRPGPDDLGRVRRGADRRAGGRAVSALEPGDAAALHRVLAARRDVRSGFTSDPVDGDVLRRVFAAAHTAPSVGFSQPWDFLVLRDPVLRAELASLAAAQRDAFASSLPAARARDVRRAQGGGDPRGAARRRRHLRPDPRRPSRARTRDAAADGRALGRGRGAEPVARGAGRGSRRRMGELLPRTGAGRAAGRARRPAAAPRDRRLPLPRARDVVRRRARAPIRRLGPAPTAGVGRARGQLGQPRRRRRPGRGARGLRLARRHRGGGRRARAADPHDRAAGGAGADGRRRCAPGRARRWLPASGPGARGGGGVRRGPRGARVRRDAVAAGGDPPDGRQLPRRRRGGERVRQPGGGRGRRRRRRGGGDPRRGAGAAAAQGPARDGGHDGGPGDDP